MSSNVCLYVFLCVSVCVLMFNCKLSYVYLMCSYVYLYMILCVSVCVYVFLSEAVCDLCINMCSYVYLYVILCVSVCDLMCI
jgi:hypothetical protein